jgi:cytochrome c-type biogenesis protein CcmH
MKKLAFLLALVFLLAGYSQAAAQDPTPIPDDQVNAIAKDLYCPVCENIPLNVCPTKACAQWRELIREKLALGWSQKEIEVFFAEQYGEKVLAVPRAAGFNWVIYILPPVFVLLGIILVVRVLRRSKNKPQPDEARNHASVSVTPDLLKKIENDLKEKE